MTDKITINDIFDNANDGTYKNEYEINMEHLSDEFCEESGEINGQAKLLANLLMVMVLTVLLVYFIACQYNNF